MAFNYMIMALVKILSHLETSYFFFFLLLVFSEIFNRTYNEDYTLYTIYLFSLYSILLQITKNISIAISCRYSS